MWEKNRGVVLTAEACLSSLPVDTADMVREAHAWLSKHGGINYGALQVGKGGLFPYINTSKIHVHLVAFR